MPRECLQYCVQWLALSGGSWGPHTCGHGDPVVPFGMVGMWRRSPGPSGDSVWVPTEELEGVPSRHFVRDLLGHPLLNVLGWIIPWHPRRDRLPGGWPQWDSAPPLPLKIFLWSSSSLVQASMAHPACLRSMPKRCLRYRRLREDNQQGVRQYGRGLDVFEAFILRSLRGFADHGF